MVAFNLCNCMLEVKMLIDSAVEPSRTTAATAVEIKGFFGRLFNCDILTHT